MVAEGADLAGNRDVGEELATCRRITWGGWSQRSQTPGHDLWREDGADAPLEETLAVRVTRRDFMKAGSGLALLPLIQDRGSAQNLAHPTVCRDRLTGDVLPPIRLDSLPAYGTGKRCVTFDNVPCKGVWGEHVTGLAQFPQGEDPRDYQICSYIRVADGWWTKPTWAEPSVSLKDAGVRQGVRYASWEASVTTGRSDPAANLIIAYLTPRGFKPPLLAGDAFLPPEIEGQQFPKAIADRGTRRIEFSGLQWSAKEALWDPGPNYFSASPKNVWVDDQGLHLKITRVNGRWLCPEVISEQTFGYGRYIWTVAGRVDQLNENVVFALFTYDLVTPQPNHGEIDIEFSRWGNRGSAANAQYVVQPYTEPGSLHRFGTQLPEEITTHILEWGPEAIRFQTLRGDYPTAPDASDILHAWDYPPSQVRSHATVPQALAGNARMNLWLSKGIPPSDRNEVEVVIRRFTFVP
jgi:hypothetical protein